MVDLQNGTDIGSVAKYSCITDRFRLIPETSRRRTCGMDNWDGVDPSCGECIKIFYLAGNIEWTSSQK